MPPPKLAIKVLNKISKDDTKGTVILPVWKSAPFWPLLMTMMSNDIIKDKFEFSSALISRGRGNNGLFGKKDNFKVIA